MSSAGRAASSSGCVGRPRGRETGLTGYAEQIQRSLPTGSSAMEPAEHREPYESRGSRTDLGAPGGESPPGDSTGWYPWWQYGHRPLSARLARSPASRRTSLHRTTSRRSAWRREPQSRAIARSGIVGSVLAGDTRRLLGQIVGDREPRRLVDDKRVRVGADAGIIIERRQRDAIERHGARVGLRAARVFVEFHQHGRAAHFTESAMRARCRLVKRDKLIADEKAKIGCRDPRPRAEWRAMSLLALPAMAMRGSHQGAVNLKAHSAAQAASAQRGHTAASLLCSSNTL